MRILFVCHRLPFPPNRGGKIRPFHIVQHLGRKHSVVVASLAHTKQELREGQPLADYCEQVIAEVLPDRVRWMQAFRALCSTMPSSVAYFWSERLAVRIREAFQQKQFDAIFVHCAFVAPYVRNLPCGFRVLDYGDVDSGKWFDYARSKTFPLSLGYWIEAKKLRRFEEKMAGDFNLCTTTTQGELEQLQELNADVPSAVIPNGVDLSYFYPRPGNPGKSAVLVFLGRMDYFPNIDGTLYFARNIFPLIRKNIPHAEFRIVGSNPTRAIRSLAKIPGISVTGHVSDVRPYLLDAAVAVAPLRIARGTQNKILQFLAMGVPVVTTPHAAKGVGAQPGQHFLVAEGPAAFARQVVRLLQDPKLQETFSSAGRAPLITAHSWPISMQILDRLLESGRPSAENIEAAKLTTNSR